MTDLNEERKPNFKVNTKQKGLHPRNPLDIIWKRLSLDMAMKLAMKLKQGKLRVRLLLNNCVQASFLHTAVQESFREPAYKQILFHLFSEVLNSQTRLSKDLLPLFTYLVHSGISEVSLGDLLKSVLFDPSKILAVVLPQAGLEDEERRPEALVLVGCSGNCSNPEVVEALCSAVKFVRGL
ncbi:hypothetical protein RHMOL_Rhmol01G0022000 [Rhododendron molle]|uniref:Uncharacterized protein n=1 Tax=Rhododendron molle TaxID=49168 RepID=A0ACC0PYN9_RHOML|nr:hypothetical protein RHMOL_Rhmol01G0022000 [Rhododendron molle]